MATPYTLADFCRFALGAGKLGLIDDPVRLGALFREYTDIERTPNLKHTVDLVRSFGIDIHAVDYLDTGGINMAAKGAWHIHYAAKDRPPTQKFDILHELFEVLHKTMCEIQPEYQVLTEPQLSRHADRFAAAVLLPPRFFVSKANAAGCDLVKLSGDLELSHQCLLVAMGQNFSDIPLVGVLYEHRNREKVVPNADLNDFVATVVTKTTRARRVKLLCGLQTVPARNSHPDSGSLVCAAIKGGLPLLWRNTHNEESPIILVRTLLSAGGSANRIIMLAVPSSEFGMIAPQVEMIDPVLVDGASLCPSREKCEDARSCFWHAIGVNYDR